MIITFIILQTDYQQIPSFLMEMQAEKHITKLINTFANVRSLSEPGRSDFIIIISNNDLIKIQTC